MKELIISIKPFLNKKLDHIIDDEGQTCWPLYYQITYQRKNTQLKSNYNKYIDSISSLSIETKELIDFETKNLRKSIIYLIAKEKEVFSLTGMKAKHSFYIQSVDEIFQYHLKKKLIKAISHSSSEFQYVLRFEGFDVNFLTLLKASKLLMDGISKTFGSEFKLEIEAYKAFRKLKINQQYEFNYLTLIDILDNDMKNELIHQMIEHFEEDEKEALKMSSILLKIIDDLIKNV